MISEINQWEAGGRAKEAVPPVQRQEQSADRNLSRPFEIWIGQNPVLSVGLAITLGAILGCWIKRR
jgi:ElaB/YqjD/DUF883 family membrane-anchored ribosome-binding protein